MTTALKTKGKGGQPQDPTVCPNGIDTSTFFSPHIPEEIKVTVPLLHSTPVDIVKTYISSILHYLLSHSVVSELNENVYGQNGISARETNLMISGLYLILKLALRNKVKLSAIKGDLLKMNIPQAVVEEIGKVVSESRTNYELLSQHYRISSFHKLEKVRWRIDVVISSGSLSRVMRPNILIQVRDLCCGFLLTSHFSFPFILHFSSCFIRLILSSFFFIF
jgi:hypothetical protein